MTNHHTAITLPTGKTQKTEALPADVVALEILQDNFASNDDREEFSRAIKLHGITFLQLSHSPLPPPSERDMNVMGKLAQALACFWPQSLVIGGDHD
jgi:hypothetical protein